jgi:hypothetical protein
MPPICQPSRRAFSVAGPRTVSTMLPRRITKVPPPPLPNPPRPSSTARREELHSHPATALAQETETLQKDPGWHACPCPCPCSCPCSCSCSCSFSYPYPCMGFPPRVPAYPNIPAPLPKASCVGHPALLRSARYQRLPDRGQPPLLPRDDPRPGTVSIRGCVLARLIGCSCAGAPAAGWGCHGSAHAAPGCPAGGVREGRPRRRHPTLTLSAAAALLSLSLSLCVSVCLAGCLSVCLSLHRTMLRRRHVQAGAVFTGRLPHGPAEGPIHHRHLPPECTPATARAPRMQRCAASDRLRLSSVRARAAQVDKLGAQAGPPATGLCALRVCFLVVTARAIMFWQGEFA